MTRTRIVGFGTVLATLLSVSAAAEVAHPLDPLSEDEIAIAIEALAASGRTSRDTRAAIITLAEPDKATIRAWETGDPMGRHARAVLRTDGVTSEVRIDVTTGAIVSWRDVAGAQPPILSSEWRQAQALIRADPAWRAAMAKRGYVRFDDIFCESLSAGYFGTETEDGRRLMKLPCYDVSGATTNIYSRPIEGVLATVDLDQGAVIDVVDYGVLPVSGAPDNFDGDETAVPSALTPNAEIRLTGRLLDWHNWRFHLGFDAQFGPVISLLNFNDAGRWRSVLYQAHISEVFVPYMDPDPAWAFRTYMDAGEYGLGLLSSSLTPGIDCPEDAHFIDALMATPTGRPHLREQAICVFERKTQDPLWRHAEAFNGAHAGKRETELVVRSIPSIAHYDYVIDWVFSDRGEIEIRIGATGIDAVKGSMVRTMAELGAAEETRYGNLVAPGLVAIHHDHFFSVRLDFDLDDGPNRFLRETFEKIALPETSARRSLWRIKSEPVAREAAFRAIEGPAVWRLENPLERTELGHAPGYQIRGTGPVSLLDADDWPQRRGAFSSHNLWITAYRPGELYAAGAFPNQSSGGEGLPAYVNAEDISSSDLVAWYTIGFRHVTRPEDWPILSTVWQSVKLTPYKFFDRNPAVHRTKPQTAAK